MEGEFKKRIKKGIQVFPDGTYDDEPLYEMVDEAKKEFPLNIKHYKEFFEVLCGIARNLGTLNDFACTDGPLLLEWFEKWFGEV